MKQIAGVETARLTALADYLDFEVPAADFDLRAWVGRLPMAPKTTLFGLVELDPGCGFAGCAMGWAGYSRLFPGFYACNDGSLRYYTPPHTFEPYKNWMAVHKLMGINDSVGAHLFCVSGYKVKATTAMVATRIRRFVAKIEAIRARDRRRAEPKQYSLRLVA